MSDLISGWSCDQKKRDPDSCRDPHGCHCREITAQRSAIETLTREKSALETANATFRKDTAETENRIIDAEFAAQEMKCRAEAAESALREALLRVTKLTEAIEFASAEGFQWPADPFAPAATSEDK